MTRPFCSTRCRHASVTIVLVTVVYIVLNVPYWLYLVRTTLLLLRKVIIVEFVKQFLRKVIIKEILRTIINLLLLQIVWLVDFKYAGQWFGANDPNDYLYTFLNPFSMLLNAGVNPLIYFIRMRKIRESLGELCKRGGNQAGRFSVVLGLASPQVVNPSKLVPMDQKSSIGSLNSFAARRSLSNGRKSERSGSNCGVLSEEGSGSAT